MRFALIADTYPPLSTSGAIQIRDLAEEFVKQGHEITVFTPLQNLEARYSIELINGVKIVRFKLGGLRNSSYLHRTKNEFLMPFRMKKTIKKLKIDCSCFDHVLWYSPSIFFGPLVKYIKRQSHCPSYLIIRDIFPDWALDMQLIRDGLVYRFLKLIANYQYFLADTIAVQSAGNLSFFYHQINSKRNTKVVVLQNWLSKQIEEKCPINLDQTILSGRTIFVYSGNMGIAQNVDVLLNLAKFLHDNETTGFVFVGRGSESSRLKEQAESLNLENVLFFDEIKSSQMSDLYKQCSVGLVALDTKHSTHNIPGKFVSYMQHELPVLASINRNNDLVDLILHADVGRVATEPDLEILAELAYVLLEKIKKNHTMKNRCRKLFLDNYTSSHAVNTILCTLGGRN